MCTGSLQCFKSQYDIVFMKHNYFNFVEINMVICYLPLKELIFQAPNNHAMALTEYLLRPDVLQTLIKMVPF